MDSGCTWTAGSRARESSAEAVGGVEPVLWYVADPMCSWCWGFAPVVDAIKEQFGERVKLALLLGGLRPYTRDPMPPAQREEILHHWHQVHARSGQPFAFEGAMPPGFVYDTEPASRAVVAMAEIDPSKTFAMFKSIQRAFYAEQKDVTQAVVLAGLASGLEVSPESFLPVFQSAAAAERTRGHFQRAQQLGVRGFPALILQRPAGYNLLAAGWQPFEELQPKIEGTLAQS